MRTCALSFITDFIKSHLNRIAIILFLFMVSGCSSTQYMPPLSTYTPSDSVYQYSDKTIADAFRKRPQIDPPLTVALYDVGYETLEIANHLEQIEEISSVTHISPALIEGSAYYERISNPWYSYYNNPPQTKPVEIRNLAAQSHADILLYIGTHHQVFTDTNALSVFYLPLVPMLFVKGNSINVSSYVDMYIIDVRNGFIYNSFRTQAKSKDKFVKINHDKDIKRLRQRNINSLKDELLKEVERVLQKEDFMLGLK